MEISTMAKFCFWRKTTKDMIMTFVQTLYESSIAFGIRKALQAEQGESFLLFVLFLYSLGETIGFFLQINS